MTKEELWARLARGKTMEELFMIREGQDCPIVKMGFQAGDEILYIPDFWLNEIPEDRPITDPERIKEVLACCYTGDDFLNECGGDEVLARELHAYCDWQHPSSALPEIEPGREEIGPLPGRQRDRDEEPER